MGSQESDSFEIESKHKELVDSVRVMIDKLENPIVSEQCIYRAPLKVRGINEAAYTPRVISIGPFHHEDERLKSMESLQQIKLIYLKSFLDRTKLKLEFCISELKARETKIRNCYAENIQQKSDDFVRMILIDSCFIIEHFLKYYKADQWRESDPLFLKPWLAEDVAQDLILLENQLPFFVLEGLHNLATKNDPDLPSFLQITFRYFKALNQQATKYDVVSVRHFTDLLRTFYLSPSRIFQKRSEVGSILEHLYCASDLVKSGLEFRENKTNKCLLELQYVEGVLTMPRLDISDRTEIHLRNIVAFEQYHYPSETYITDYLKVLDFLINSERDVDILIHKRIITTLLGDSNEVATMINHLCSNLIQPNMNLQYLLICKQLNEFYEEPIHKWKTSMIHDYFGTPVKIATSIAAIVLLILTLVQTICSVYPLIKGT
ncbi:UPF0481 protein At3g47200-like [Diospyros lotus]|uniref:UPF0481 protein At3g47200-like n=1 Tax=Diospyros lotus TaxID=55363 RepID=UPI002257F105|nr:UPF0481 protein At3g47200-like [Diospyros lotus]